MAINGDTLILSVYDGAAYRPVACLTSNALNQTRNIIESQTKCDPGETIKTAGTKNYTVTGEGEYIDTTSAGGFTTRASHDYLKTIFEGQDTVTWRLATGLTDNPNYYGTGIISDLSLTAPANDTTTFSVTIEGSGAIVTVDPV